MTEFGAPMSGVGWASNGHANGRPERQPVPVVPPASSPPALPSRGFGLTLMAIAAVLGVAALAVGAWAFAKEHRAATRVQPPVRIDGTAPFRRAVSLIASPQAERIPLAQSVGRLVLVLDEHGRGLLVVRHLGRAPVGFAYQAWVIPDGAEPVLAARFAGGEQIVWLSRTVPHAARVAVTLERSVGAPAPTRRLRLVARRR